MKQLSILLLTISLWVPLQGQPVTEGQQIPPGAVVYSLPRTCVRIVAEAVYVNFNPGPYARYARKFLGIDAGQAKTTTYELSRVEMTPMLEADPHQLYVVNLSTANAQPWFLQLTSQGLVLGTDIYGYILSGGATAPVGPDTYTATGQGISNPDMPAGGIYGIKFDSSGSGSTSWTIEFTSTRRPVWGDFYAKCGAQGGEFNTVFNSGFTGGFFDAYGVVDRDGTPLDNRLAVPDSVVPEPSAFLGLAFGLPLLLRRLKPSR